MELVHIQKWLGWLYIFICKYKNQKQNETIWNIYYKYQKNWMRSITLVKDRDREVCRPHVLPGQRRAQQLALPEPQGERPSTALPSVPVWLFKGCCCRRRVAVKESCLKWRALVRRQPFVIAAVVTEEGYLQDPPKSCKNGPWSGAPSRPVLTGLGRVL